jgi:hypothetical protein
MPQEDLPLCRRRTSLRTRRGFPELKVGLDEHPRALIERAEVVIRAWVEAVDLVPGGLAGGTGYNRRGE